MAGETIAVFASDCVTPRSAFTLGETVCAKTDGVDLTTPNNYYMNWIDSQLNQTNGGSITQNPQFFLFVPPTVDSYKATIGRVNPADSSIIGNPPIFTVSAGAAISTYASNCTTPQTTFTLGDTVCAKVSGVDPTFNRRFAWVDPAGNIRKFTTITTNPQTDTFLLPTADIDPTYGNDNRGAWKVDVVSSRGSVVLGAKFQVQAQTPATDLSIGKGQLDGAFTSGGDAKFAISVYNRGPNDAANVVITDATPANATFQSAGQTNGSDFTCTGSTTVTCTGAILKAGDTALFEFVYTAGATGTTITNTASVASDTQELDNRDNSSTVGPITIGPDTGGGGTCTVACPDDIQTPANTTDGGGNPGAIVHFSPPSGNLACGTVTADHCNDCFFPEGTTVVTGTAADTGDSCSFTVTITPAGSAPTISCPANKTGNADSTCQATFALGTATASGQNVTVVAYRSDGLPVYTCDEFGNCTRNSSDAPFNVGTSTVTWYAYSHDIAGPYTAQTGDEESHRNGSSTCTQTVTVNDVTPPTIAATSQTIPADATCQAAVPDYSSTVSDNCACDASDTSADCQNHNQLGYSQTPAAGTVVGLGSYTIHIEANDGTNSASKDITLTVADQTAPQITCPANITTNTAPGTCSATVNPGTATATDNCDTTPTIVGTRSDNQPLNATYPKGTTTIHWTATDDAGNSSSCDQTVTVEDHEPPTISCPSSITIEPTCPSGAIGTYTAPVGQDNCPGAQTTRTAGGASGSVFPIGTTTVTYTVTDASGNTASCSFTITVKTVLQTLDDLRASVNANTQLNGTQKNGLLAKLDAAKQAIQSGSQNGACAKLSDFVNSTQNFISHGDISAATGNAWISTANNIRNAIGCTNNPCS
ncbi:MAG TPA: HYR domain-containing protein [Pyrinomonadaceae bacterium]|nr:HYR domain-containing protein [Pyrinomonadaceae bacterium]